MANHETIRLFSVGFMCVSQHAKPELCMTTHLHIGHFMLCLALGERGLVEVFLELGIGLLGHHLRHAYARHDGRRRERERRHAVPSLCVSHPVCVWRSGDRMMAYAQHPHISGTVPWH